MSGLESCVLFKGFFRSQTLCLQEACVLTHMGCLTGLLCRDSFSLQSVLGFPPHILSSPGLLWCCLWYSPTRVLAVCVLVCSCCSAKAQNQGGMSRKQETHLSSVFWWWVRWYIQFAFFFRVCKQTFVCLLLLSIQILDRRCESCRCVLSWAEAAFSHFIFLKKYISPFYSEVLWELPLEP